MERQGSFVFPTEAGVEFLNPGILAFAAAAAAPVVLHLIMRPNPRRVVFPAMRFIQQRRESNRRRLRLRHWLLLFLRVAALALVAFALARPSIQASGVSLSAEAPVSVALVFDTSPSMGYQRANRTRLEAAEEIAGEILSELPRGSQVAVLESAPGAADFQVDVAAAKNRIDRLQIADAPRDLLSVVVEALRLLEQGEHEARELFLFTDLAKGEWSPEAASAVATQMRKSGDVGVQVIDVGVSDPENTALGQPRLSGQVVPRNTPVRLRIELARTGADEEKTVRLNLLNPSGEPEKVDQTTLSLPGGQAREVEFVVSGREPGVHQGEVRIVGRDALEMDDVRWFTFEVRPAFPVLLAAPQPADFYAFYLREALAPETLRLSDRARFNCEVVAEDKLGEIDLQEYAAVFLIDPSSLPAETFNKLAAYVRSGGGLGIFLGRNASVISMNSDAAQALFPARLTQRARWPEGDTHLRPEDFQHPLLRRFRSLKDQMPWDGAPVYQAWQLGPLAPEARTVIPYSNGQPALVERIVGQGRVLTLTTPISDELDAQAWNQFPTSLEPLPFFMLANEMALYLVGAGDEELNFVARPGLTVALELDRKEGIDAYVLRRLGGQASRRNSDPAEPRLVISSIPQAGAYRAVLVEENIDRGFSVNLSAEESDLARAEEADLQAAFGEEAFTLARRREEIRSAITRRRVGVELFPLLMALVALALGVEHVLSNRFYGMRDHAPPEPVEKKTVPETPPVAEEPVAVG